MARLCFSLLSVFAILLSHHLGAAVADSCRVTVPGFEDLQSAVGGTAQNTPSTSPDCVAVDGKSVRHGFRISSQSGAICCVERGVYSPETGVCAIGCDGALLALTDFFVHEDRCYRRCFGTLTDVCTDAPLLYGRRLQSSDQHTVDRLDFGSHQSFVLATGSAVLSAFGLGSFEPDGNGPDVFCTGRGRLLGADNDSGGLRCQCNNCGDIRSTGFAYLRDSSTHTDVCYFDCFTADADCFIYGHEGTVLSEWALSSCGNCYRRCRETEGCAFYRFQQGELAPWDSNACPQAEQLANICVLHVSLDALPEHEEAVAVAGAANCTACYDACSAQTGCVAFTYNNLGRLSRTAPATTACAAATCQLQGLVPESSVDRAAGSCADCFDACHINSHCFSSTYAGLADAESVQSSWDFSLCPAEREPSPCILLTSEKYLLTYGYGTPALRCSACYNLCSRTPLCAYYQFDNSDVTIKEINACAGDVVAPPPTLQCILLDLDGNVLGDAGNNGSDPLYVYDCSGCQAACRDDETCAMYDFNNVGAVAVTKDTACQGVSTCVHYDADLSTVIFSGNLTCTRCFQSCFDSSTCFAYLYDPASASLENSSSLLSSWQFHHCDDTTSRLTDCDLLDEDQLELVSVATNSCEACRASCDDLGTCFFYHYDNRGATPFGQPCPALDDETGENWVADTFCVIYSGARVVLAGVNSEGCAACHRLCLDMNDTCTGYNYNSMGKVARDTDVCIGTDCFFFNSAYQQASEHYAGSCDACYQSCLSAGDDEQNSSCTAYMFQPSHAIGGYRWAKDSNVCAAASDQHSCAFLDWRGTEYVRSLVADCDACHEACYNHPHCFYNTYNEGHVERWYRNNCSGIPYEPMTCTLRDFAWGIIDSSPIESCSACFDKCDGVPTCFFYKYSNGPTSFYAYDKCPAVNCRLFDEDNILVADLFATSCVGCYNLCDSAEYYDRCYYYQYTSSEESTLNVSYMMNEPVAWHVTCDAVWTINYNVCNLLRPDGTIARSDRASNCQACMQSCDADDGCDSYQYNNLPAALAGTDGCGPINCYWYDYRNRLYYDTASSSCSECYDDCYNDPHCYFYVAGESDFSYYTISACEHLLENVVGCHLFDEDDDLLMPIPGADVSCDACSEACHGHPDCETYSFNGLPRTEKDKELCDLVNCVHYGSFQEVLLTLYADSCLDCHRYCLHSSQCHFYSASDSPSAIASWVTPSCSVNLCGLLNQNGDGEPIQEIIVTACADCVASCTADGDCANINYNDITSNTSSGSALADVCLAIDCIFYDGNLNPVFEFASDSGCDECANSCYLDEQCIYYSYDGAASSAWNLNSCSWAGGQAPTDTVTCSLMKAAGEAIAQVTVPNCASCYYNCLYHIDCVQFSVNNGAFVSVGSVTPCTPTP